MLFFHSTAIPSNLAEYVILSFYFGLHHLLNTALYYKLHNWTKGEAISYTLCHSTIT